MESTYGDRRHRGREDTSRELGAILAQAARDGGNVIVPAFAIGRSQELLYLLAKNYGEWHVARWKIFLDSPMAIAASRVYWQHPDRYDEETSRLRASFRGMPPLPNLVLSETPDDSRAINNVRGGAIIIAGSRHGQWRPRPAPPETQSAAPRVPRAHRRLPGAGHARTPARRPPAGGAHPRPHGARARRRFTPSAGCPPMRDQAQLLRWYDSFEARPPVCLVHGEVPAAEALAVKLRELGAQATVTRPGLTIDLASLNALARD